VQNQGCFVIAQCAWGSDRGLRIPLWRRKGIRKQSIVRSDYGSFNQILEFPHIAGPIVCSERIHRCLRYVFNALPHTAGKYFDEMQDQQAYILSALT
jgi:hypothetical protein